MVQEQLAGVVIVTTKSGTTVDKKMNKPTISYDGYYGITHTARMPDFQNAQEFYNYRFSKFLVYGGGLATANSGQPIYVPDCTIRWHWQTLKRANTE